MKLLNRLTIKNLKLNKARTIVTIIGIVLSTALITSIVTLVSSFQTSMKEYIKETQGDYHYEFMGVSSYDVLEIKKKENVNNVFLTQNIGYSSISEHNINFQILGFSEEAMQKLGVELTEGRLPQNENEIIISDSIEAFENIKYDIGTRITLTIDNEKGSNLSNTISNNQVSSKTYEIVGIVNILDEKIEPRVASKNATEPFYYTIIMPLCDYLENNKFNVYVKYKDLDDRIETVVEILNIDEESFEKIKSENRRETEEKLYENENNKYKYIINNALIELENEDYIDSTFIMMYSISLVIIIVIMITSICCIRNSFNISITEKMRQYGMLASIGATSKQIKRNVLYEALILGIVGIPIGIMLGIGLIYIILRVVEKILYENLFGMQLIFSTNLIAIVLSILLSGLTIYFSAKKSAEKTSKISPMEAIRSNKDIKIKSEKIKSSRLIKKLFGVGGDIAYKNLRRNSRKYRTTVISIIISVSIFIAMCSFINYAFKAKVVYYDNYDYNVYMLSRNYQKLKEIAENLNLKKYSLVRNAMGYCKDEEVHYSKEAIEINYSYPLELISLGTQEYNRFVNKLGLKYNEVKNKGILLDYATELFDMEGKKYYKIFRVYDYQEGDMVEFENGNQQINIEIATITDEMPMHLKGNSSGVYLVVSDEFMDKKKIEVSFCDLYTYVENDIELKEYIEKNYSSAYFYIGNMDEEAREERAMSLVISIFLYSFIAIISLIGVTNIFNTITTSMKLRQKEFANLKAIGMTKREFDKMVRLESLFYGMKSLIIGIPLGIIFSYLIHKAFNENIKMSYILPVNGIIIAIIVVCILIGSIMKYSLNNINKQNIIDTIRKDNI